MSTIDPNALPLVLWASFLLYAALGGYAFLRSRDRVSMIFGLLMTCCAMTALGYYYQITVQSLQAKVVWMQISFIFYPFLTLLWLAVSVHLAGVSHWFRPILWKLLLVVPVATVVLALTAQYHPWFRHTYWLEPLGPLRLLHYKNGPGFTFYIFYTHAVGLLGVFLMIAARPSATLAVRRHITGLLVCYLLPVLFDVLFQCGKTPLRGLNLTVFFFVPTSLITAWLVFQHRLLNLEPIARSVVLEHMEEGVVVVDNNGRIADMNARAGQMLGIDRLKVLGRTPEVFPAPWRELFMTKAASLGIPTATRESRQHWVESSSVELFDSHRTRVGRLYLLRDVTAAVEREAQTKRLLKLEAEQERLREQERLTRDLHDGLGALSAHLGMLAVRGARETDPAAKERLLGQINQLSCEMGMEVRELMSSLETREFFWGDLLHNLRRYAALVLDNAGVRWKLTVTGAVPAIGPGYAAGHSLFCIVREALNNLLKHAGAQSVDIAFDFQPGLCHVEIRDDGSGFDPACVRPGGRGLKNMRHRAGEWRGAMEIQTSPSGTRLVFTLPLPFALAKDAPAGVDESPTSAN